MSKKENKMSKNFNYEIRELKEQYRKLGQLAWNMKMKWHSRYPYVKVAIGKILKSRINLIQAIEILEKKEVK